MMRDAVGAIGAHAHTLAEASEELSVVSRQIALSAGEASDQTVTASEAAEHVSRNVQTVATGAAQMGQSIEEIAGNAAQAAQVAAEAVSMAHTANRTVSELGESSAQIGNVVRLITTIAEQTNLLALNTTIEAARAGAAGKGFAVVATEVKDLAQETARATEEISTRVRGIQSDIANAVEAIGRIGEVIERINGFSLIIASAVEEQPVTTGEMTRNVAEAATGTEQIAGSITGVATAARTTTARIDESTRAAAELARMSGQLTELFSRFTC